MGVDELDFLRESNNIEDEWDDKSLEDAILAWEHCKDLPKLSREVVLEIHGILMHSRDTLEPEQKGVFRDGPVWIGGHEALKSYLIEDKLKLWLSKINESVEASTVKKEEPEYLKWKGETLDNWSRKDHIVYEGIHPFFDGNGRTGRIFYNWQRIHCGLPVHIIHTGKEQYEYYNWFK